MFFRVEISIIAFVLLTLSRVQFCEEVVLESIGPTGIPSINVVHLEKRVLRVLYAGTYADGVLKSYDGGDSWIPASNGLKSKDVSILYSMNDVVYAGTRSGGVFKTVNGGAYWISINNGLKGLNVSMFYSINDVLYVGTDYGVFKSLDEGALWTQLNNGLTGHYIRVRHLLIVCFEEALFYLKK